MKYKIIFSENAKRDLISIVRYISDELLEPNRDIENQLEDRVTFVKQNDKYKKTV